MNKPTITNLAPSQPEPTLDGEHEFFLKEHLDAGAVYLGGTFPGNNWETWKWPMKRTNKGWVCRIDLPPGKYHYKYVVDGKAIFDPENPSRETNCEGRTNSVYVVE